ncbi:hypothetical protein BD626DRAFT_160068 [Schizophyllum amplum]|uniref:Uncharacterized protein n=1 Tax=Schizophyllum amplum TaxID=97359 RepID=A0A550CP03_9AGAR|nr:hypothetical protein BD626DRAFT_160068 [Auriculariopsis ampla]
MVDVGGPRSLSSRNMAATTHSPCAPGFGGDGVGDEYMDRRPASGLRLLISPSHHCQASDAMDHLPASEDLPQRLRNADDVPAHVAGPGAARHVYTRARDCAVAVALRRWDPRKSRGRGRFRGTPSPVATSAGAGLVAGALRTCSGTLYHVWVGLWLFGSIVVRVRPRMVE